MSNYTGQKCPVCSKAFTDQDDIVVCPDCGTPYHRSCWEIDGVCVSAAKHGTGYEWKPTGEPAATAVTCPRCGHSNPSASRFCNNCGSPLAVNRQEQPPRVRCPADNSFGAGEQRARDEFEQARRAGFVEALRSDDLIDGVKAKDWAAFLGHSAPFYIIHFHHMAETGRRLCVSFAAFVFGPAYFIYRKAWKPAAFFAALSLLLTVPSVIALLYVAGGLPAAMQNVALINTLSAVASYTGWLLRIVRGMFGVYMYKQYALPKVRSICNAIPEGPDRQAALARVGGTNPFGVALYFLAWVLLYLLLVFFIARVLGPEAVSRINAYAEAMLRYMA